MVLNDLLERTRQRRVTQQAVRWRVGGTPEGLFAYARPASPNGWGIGGWPVAAVDVETTGFGPRDHRIVEIAVVRVEPDGRRREYATLLNPDRDPGPVFVHHITARQVQDAPRFADVAGDVLALLDGAVVAAHNASFEERFLAAELDRCGLAPSAIPTVCTLEFARHGLPGLPNHKLATVASACGAVLDGAHTALGDARAVAGMLGALVERIPPALPVTPVMQGFVPGRVRPVTRAGKFTKGESWMVSLLNRLPLSTGDADPVEVDAYLEVLDAALADGRLVGDEARALASVAGQAGLGQAEVRALHHRYLDACRDAALEDEVLTPSELQELTKAAQLLGEPDYFADLSATPASSERDHPQQRRPSPLRVQRAGHEGALGGARVWLSPACPPELAQAVAAAGGWRAANLTRSCVAVVIDPADAGHPAAQRATDLGVPVLDPERAWTDLELTRPTEDQTQPEQATQAIGSAQTDRDAQPAGAVAVQVPATPDQRHSPAVPAGWYPDPTGRWPWRWWDGATWTPHVARPGAGTTELDSLQ